MKPIRAVLPLLLAAASARADEGMWTYNAFPAQKVGQKYGFTPSDKWLDQARLSSVRLAGGCSGSFVSPNGLVMTNHHCAHSCIEQLSTARTDYVKAGFYAPAQKDEVKCPEIELNQLLAISDVTSRIQEVTKGLSGREFTRAQRGEMSAIEKECSGGDEGLRCAVVTLFSGGRYELYRYKRYQEVRLVFAPEFAIAFFGGDPDNFEFPRYDLDVAFLRAYEQGKPAKTGHHFAWSKGGAKEGELTFVSGNPGKTHRDLTVAGLTHERDVALPERIFWLAEYRGALTQFTKRSPENHRIGEAELFGVENSLKAFKGRFTALHDPRLIADKTAREARLRALVAQDPKLAASTGQAWDEIAAAIAEHDKVRVRYRYLEEAQAVKSRPSATRATWPAGRRSRRRRTACGCASTATRRCRR
jgi:Peptidase S46